MVSFLYRLLSVFGVLNAKSVWDCRKFIRDWFCRSASNVFIVVENSLFRRKLIGRVFIGGFKECFSEVYRASEIFGFLR